MLRLTCWTPYLHVKEVELLSEKPSNSLLTHLSAFWQDAGKFLDFFSDDYKEFLPHGLDVYYGMIPDDILDIINNHAQQNF